MSRQLKFRGKREDNGDWVFGNLIQMSKDSSQCFIFPFYNYASSLSCSQIVAMDMVAVIPETIGQFTGLKDNLDNEIYEGDILRAATVLIDEPLLRHDKLSIVEFVQGGFMVARKRTKMFEIEGLNSLFGSDERDDIRRCFNGDHIEVIGNIHDREEAHDENQT